MTHKLNMAHRQILNYLRSGEWKFVWVCEDHFHQPWTGSHACTCGAAGMPCPVCNLLTPGKPVILPEEFEPD